LAQRIRIADLAPKLFAMIGAVLLEKLQQHLIKIRKLLDMMFFRVIFFIFLGAVLFTSMYSNVKPEKLDLNLFSIAETTIRSPGTVEDKKSTEKKRNDAIEQVKDVYILKNEYTQNRVDLLSSIFDSAGEVNEEIKAEREKEVEDESTEEVKTKWSEPSVSDKVVRLKAKLTDGVTKDLSDSVFSALVQSSSDELSIAKDLTVTAINNVMSKRIPADSVENVKKTVEEELRFTSLSGDLKSAAIELGRFAVVQNEFYDSDATEELRHQAAESVEPVKILQGQVVVEEGELINPDIYRQLGLVGLLDSEKALQPFFGLALIIIIFLIAIYFYFSDIKTQAEIKQTHLLLFGVIFVLSILTMKTVSLFQEIEYAEIGFIFPAAMGGMLIKILIEERLAVLLTMILSICGSIIFNEEVTGSLNTSVGIYILCSGLAGILFLRSQNQRAKILQAGIFAAFVNLIVIFALILLRNGQYSGLEYGFYIIMALFSGISSAVLTIGLLPFFEASFGILSTMKLIELSNPNHPLLRKILTEAPGTYHHSVMVANLAESACEAIGVNGLLARVGCYYHDIGKTKRPQFFIENQMNIENPHNRLTPETSADIIIAHASDGAEMLRKQRMPREIVEIAEQHHGTTLLKYFYHKAEKSSEELSEGNFRYPGPKAQTKEIAIIGVADSVEAAVRSMSQPTPEQIESLVHSIIADRLQDGQFNECDLTLKELDIVAYTLCETLKGIFHSRIEYPEIKNRR
jgi:cyclic-di-AMP phosphodiesterase PgpH